MLERLVEQQRLDRLAADLGDLAFQRAHAGLAGVEAQDVADHRLGDLQLALFQAIVADLLGQQVALGNGDLLVLGVAGQADDLHPVQQRRRDVERVGGGHEHHVRQVVIDLHIVVGEGVVLLGVEHLQQRGRGVTPVVAVDLVDLVQQEQRVAHAHLGQVLQDLARHGTDVGAAVAADLGLVMHATQCHAHVLAAGGPCNGLAQRGLAHARRADETHDGGLHLVDALLHGQVLENAFLDLFQPVVVGVEHFLGVGEIVADLAFFLPGQRQQHVDVVAHHGGLGRHGRHQAQLAELALDLLAGLFGHAGGADLLLDVLEVGTVLAFAQLLLDGLDLFVQVVLALALLHLALDAATDALLDLQDVQFVLDLGEQLFQPLGDRQGFEHVLLLVDADGQVGGDGVGQAPRILDAGQRTEDFGGHLLVELHVVLELAQDGAAQGLHLGRDGLFGTQVLQLAGEVLAIGIDAGNAGAAGALDQDLDRAVGQPEQLQDPGDAADVVHVTGRRVVLGAVALRHQHDALAGLHGGFQRLDGALAPHEQRDDHVGEDHHVAQRQKRQDQGGNVAIVHLFPDSVLTAVPGPFQDHRGKHMCDMRSIQKITRISGHRCGFPYETVSGPPTFAWCDRRPSWPAGRRAGADGSCLSGKCMARPPSEESGRAGAGARRGSGRCPLHAGPAAYRRGAMCATRAGRPGSGRPSCSLTPCAGKAGRPTLPGRSAPAAARDAACQLLPLDTRGLSA